MQWQSNGGGGGGGGELYELLMQKHVGWTSSIIHTSTRVLPENTDKH